MTPGGQRTPPQDLPSVALRGGVDADHALRDRRASLLKRRRRMPQIIVKPLVKWRDQTAAGIKLALAVGSTGKLCSRSRR